MAIIKYNNYLIGRGYNVDYDTEAFLYVVRPYDLTNNITAVDTFVKSYKAAHGVNRLVDIGDTAIYLMYGGTETACCLNLINPSLSNPYNLTKVGTPTFDANGITTNGIDSCVLAPRFMTSYLNRHVAIYSRTESQITSMDIGSYHTYLGTTYYYYLYLRNMDNNLQLQCTTSKSRSNVSSLGMFITTQSNNIVYSCIRGSYAAIGVVSGGNSNNKVAIGARCYTPTNLCDNFTAKNYAYASFGPQKTRDQCIAITNAVNQLQTDLGRAV